MPATDLSPDRLILKFSQPYTKSRYQADGITETNLYKLCRASYEGFHRESGDCVTILEGQLSDYEATEGFLDKRAQFWLIPRKEDEADEDLRLRIGGVKIRKWGAFNVDEMLSMIATLLDTNVEQIGFTENVDENGDFEPHLITFQIPLGVFEEASVDDIPSAVDDLLDVMEEAAPAGVRVRITSAGTAQFDDGVTVYDGGFTYS